MRRPTNDDRLRLKTKKCRRGKILRVEFCVIRLSPMCALDQLAQSTTMGTIGFVVSVPSPAKLAGTGRGIRWAGTTDRATTARRGVVFRDGRRLPVTMQQRMRKINRLPAQNELGGQ